MSKLLLLMLATAACAYATQPSHLAQLGKRKPPKKFDFRSPKGLFIQERESKQLPGPGQHISFGARKPWDEIHDVLDKHPGAKLLLLVRHGQAVSNWLSDTLGPNVWYDVEQTCSYHDDTTDKTWGIFDAELTDTGITQARDLRTLLEEGGWFKTMTAGRHTAAVVSPLSRVLQTTHIVLDGLHVSRVHVEENVRETLGEDTCDARRSVSSPDPRNAAKLQGPCDFTDGLRRYFPQFDFPIVDENARAALRAGQLERHKGRDKERGLGLGMLSDRDEMWTKKREGQKHQVKRAVKFLFDLFEFVDERVVVVVTHSGTVRSMLLAVGREPYRPQNAELVPVIVEPIEPLARESGAEEGGNEGWTYTPDLALDLEEE